MRLDPVYFAWEIHDGNLRPRLFLAGIPSATYSRLQVVHTLDEPTYNAALTAARRRRNDPHAIVNELVDRYPAPEIP